MISKVNNNNLKELDNVTLKKLGVDLNFLNFSESLEELKTRTPNIVIAKAVRNFEFVQNYYKVQKLKKDRSYVMSLSVFQKLRNDPSKNRKLLKPSKTTFKKLYKKYNGEPLDNKTILFWRTGGIGDLLFIQPNLIYLKEKYPTCKIIFSCAPQYQPMIDNWDCVDEITDLPFDYKQLMDSDYHAIFEGVIERCKEAEKTNCYKLFTKWLNLNLPKEKLKPSLNVKKELVDECKKIITNDFGIDFNKDKIILCQYKASSIIRSLKPEIFAEIINKLTKQNYKVIITDSPKQSKNIDLLIKTKINDKNKVFNFSEKSKSIDYTIALSSLINCCFSIDSSLIHIAQAVNTPVVGIYGPFPGYVRMETYDNCDWIDCKDVCSPCFQHGHASCKNSDKFGYSKCFEKLDTNLIVEKINKLIEE